MAQPRAIDYVIGGVSSSCAVFFSNPIETVKVRMQLQGELQRTKGFVGPYRSPFHALYLISSKEGVWSLQKGLTCAIMYQLVMNGVRMGLYEHIKNLMGVHNNDHAIHEAGESNVKVAIKELIVFSKRVAAGAMAGAVGSYIASPFFLVKTRMQSQSDAIPGVGTQHKYTSTAQAFKHIVKHDGGILGLMRGSTAAAVRVAVGGSVQLSTYDTCKHRLHATFPEFFTNPTSVKLHLAASMVSGLAVTTAMNPFDVLSTRIYNQPVDEKGRGQLYKNPLDCFIKIGRVEGFRGFFKGWFAHYLRVGPHTVLMFVFMEQFKQLAASK